MCAVAVNNSDGAVQKKHENLFCADFEADNVAHHNIGAVNEDACNSKGQSTAPFQKPTKHTHQLLQQAAA
jgi:hypothetical protein